MSDTGTPKLYDQWRTDPFGRAEDAANTFGCHLVHHCRAEALKTTELSALPKSAEEFHAHVTAAVDMALHNVMDLLEGFWRLPAGPNHRVEYFLSVSVKDSTGETMERIDISPCKLDLPVGYWKWKNGEFR